MSSLSNIRNQLRASENIKQIATSMEMVASARFRKAQTKAKQAKVYIERMRAILEHLSTASTDTRHPLLMQKKIKGSCEKCGVVIATSDKGLCGSFNANILAAADKFLSKLLPENVELILIGRKAIQYYHRKKWTIRTHVSDWSGKIKLPQVKDLSEQLVKGFLSDDLDGIWLIYTKFYTLMHREIEIEKFLPIEKSVLTPNDHAMNYLVEPDIEEVYNQILPRFCMTKIETMLNETHASE